MRWINASRRRTSILPRERRHPKAFEATVAALGDELAAIPTLVLSVSMSAAFREGRSDAVD
ncbi:MAG: hypothetical protein ACU0BS_04340 [Hasllibacter sp.]